RFFNVSLRALLRKEQRRMNAMVSQNNKGMVNLHHQNVKQNTGKNGKD
nr:hypothetical protein [Tanacetum cinerariifolium]